MRSDFPYIDAPAMQQVQLVVKPLSSSYTFEAGGVSLKVEFTAPLLPYDLEVLFRPSSYVTFAAVSVNGRTHQVEVYFDVTGELCIDHPHQEVEAFRSKLADGSAVLRMGTAKQQPLTRSGDDLPLTSLWPIGRGTSCSSCNDPLPALKVRRELNRAGNSG